MQHRVMFNHRGDEVPAFGLEQTRHAENRQVVAFRTATGENDFAGLAAQNRGCAVAGIVQNGARAPSHMMDAARIAKDAVQKRKHRVPNQQVQWRRRIIIKINRAHRCF